MQPSHHHPSSPPDFQKLRKALEEARREQLVALAAIDHVLELLPSYEINSPKGHLDSLVQRVQRAVFTSETCHPDTQPTSKLYHENKFSEQVHKHSNKSGTSRTNVDDIACRVDLQTGSCTRPSESGQCPELTTHTINYLRKYDLMPNNYSNLPCLSDSQSKVTNHREDSTQILDCDGIMRLPKL